MSRRPPWAAATMGFRIRRADASDHPALATFLRAMDVDGLYQRHFAHGEAPNLALLERLAIVDGRRRVMLLAVDGDSKVLGHAEYVAEARGAEFALMVLPAWRDRGMGLALLDSLIEVATAAGLHRLHGLIQATNTRALQLVRKRGLRPVRSDDPRTVIVSRQLLPVGAADKVAPGHVSPSTATPSNRHDPDRIPLHRCPGP
jgi:GNAT superfamily N-acetyltransferase